MHVREVADPGAGPHAPVLPLMPGVPERRSPRLRPQRRDEPLRRARRRLRQGDRGDDAAAPRRGVQEASSTRSTKRSRRARGARRARQRLDRQDAVDPALARRPPALHVPLHADLQLVAQPRRALVRRADGEEDQARHQPLPSGRLEHQDRRARPRPAPARRRRSGGSESRSKHIGRHGLEDERSRGSRSRPRSARAGRG